MELVSIISPAYNAESHLHYFLNSILSQNYGNIELVVTDDGSVDDTENVLEAYAEKFNNRGYTLKIIHKEHNGQAAAINAALKDISGSFLMWMDSDDMLESTAISDLVEYLKEHSDKDFVVCDARYVSYPDFNTRKIFQRQVDENNDTYFYDILNGTHNYTLGCGSLLVRSASFRKAIPQMKIYESPQGQNYQLMLPLLYFCRWGYLHKPLFIRVERNDSHSRKKRTYKEQLVRSADFVVLLKETIISMDIPEQKFCFKLIETRFARLSYQAALENSDKSEMKKHLKILIKNKAVTVKELLLYFKAATAMGTLLYKLYKGFVVWKRQKR